MLVTMTAMGRMNGRRANGSDDRNDDGGRIRIMVVSVVYAEGGKSTSNV